jgi:hypothetical protein
MKTKLLRGQDKLYWNQERNLETLTKGTLHFV